MRLADCRLLVTGASGGIGQALVERLCEGGARLLLVGRDRAALEQLAERFPGQVDSVCADLANPADRQRVLIAARHFEDFNGVISAAGINRFSLFEEQDEASIERLISVNVTATLQLLRLLLPELRRAPRALVINLGSTFGSLGYPGFAAYCASKFALRGFSEALRREMADTAVRVLYIAPRATRTAMNAGPVVAMNDALGVAMDDPRQVAGQIARAIEAEREELYLGWPERFFVFLNQLLPRLVDRALQRQLPVIRRFAHGAEPAVPTSSSGEQHP